MPHLRFALSFSCRGEQQQHRGGVEGQRNHEDKPAKDVLVAGVDQRRQRVFASTVSLSVRLLRFASRRSSSAARSLEIGDVLKVMARTERRWWARHENVHEPHAPTKLAERRNVSSCRRG